MIMLTTAIKLIFVVALGLVFVSCGGGSGDSAAIGGTPLGTSVDSAPVLVLTAN